MADNQFFQGMLKIFEEELKKHEYTFLLHAVGEDQDDVSVAVQLAKEAKGLIFLGGQMDYLDTRHEEIGVPYVLCTVAVNMTAPKRKCSSVSIDDKRKATKSSRLSLQKRSLEDSYDFR